MRNITLALLLISAGAFAGSKNENSEPKKETRTIASQPGQFYCSTTMSAYELDKAMNRSCDVSKEWKISDTDDDPYFCCITK